MRTPEKFLACFTACFTAFSAVFRTAFFTAFFTFLASWAAIAMLSPAAQAQAQAQSNNNYPDRPIRLIVPYAAGGGTDTVARIVAQELGKFLRQPVVVENRPGASTITGTQSVVKAAPDGYTLLMGTANLATNAALFRQLPYQVLDDLAPVSLITRVPVFAFARAQSGIGSLRDLMAQAENTPGGINYATAGNGSAPHLAAELFKLESRGKLEHIPYKGSAEATVALIGGQVPVMFDNLPATLAHVKAGSVIPLAIAMPERSSVAPGVPTLRELGYAVDAYSWWGVLAPAATPQAIVERLSREIRKTLENAAIRTKLTEQGIEPVGSTPAAFAEHIRAETGKWKNLVRAANIQTQ